MINKSKNIIVCTPFFEKIGGTEIEALLTAIHFYDTNQHIKKVAIFSPRESSPSFFKEIIQERNIIFLTYPFFFNFKSVIWFNRILKKIGLKMQLLESVFWFFISLEYSNFFVLTYPNCSYFFPLFNFYSYKKKYIAKITMWHFEPLQKAQISIYNKFTNVIVFNEEQKIFWVEKNELKKTIYMDIMILNESNLLNLSQKTFTKDFLVFGYLGRISREKNIEDIILLIDFLNNKNNKKCKLIIQGEGDFLYVQELELLISKFNLKDFIEIRKNFINPFKTHLYYQIIDVFLVTSTIEGGPMTALEAAAGGCFIIGYDIGAMQDRFGSFPYVVNQNFNALCHSTLDFSNLSKNDKRFLLNDFRDYYISKLSNSTKALRLNKLFQ